MWKSTDGGVTWHSVSDRFFKTSSVGALAIDESNLDIVYVGMGDTGFWEMLRTPNSLSRAAVRAAASTKAATSLTKRAIGSHCASNCRLLLCTGIEIKAMTW